VSHVSLSNEVTFNLLERSYNGDIQAFVVAYRKGGRAFPRPNNSRFFGCYFLASVTFFVAKYHEHCTAENGRKTRLSTSIVAPSEKKRQRNDENAMPLAGSTKKFTFIQQRKKDMTVDRALSLNLNECLRMLEEEEVPRVKKVL